MQHFNLADHPDHFKPLGSSERSQAAVMTLKPGQSTGGPDNRHDDSDQWLYVIFGSGRAIVNEQAIELSPNTLVLIEAGEAHEITAGEDAPLVTFSVYAPAGVLSTPAQAHPWRWVGFRYRHPLSCSLWPTPTCDRSWMPWSPPAS